MVAGRPGTGCGDHPLLRLSGIPADLLERRPAGPGLAPELVSGCSARWATGSRWWCWATGGAARSDAAAGRADLILAYRTPARDRDLGVFRRAGAARGRGDLLTTASGRCASNSATPPAIAAGCCSAKATGGLRPLCRPPRATSNGFRQPTEPAAVRQRRLHRPRTAHRHAVRADAGRRREHPCAARTADGGLSAGGGLRHRCWRRRWTRSTALRGYRDDGSIQRWLTTAWRLSAPRRQPRGRQ